MLLTREFPAGRRHGEGIRAPEGARVAFTRGPSRIGPVTVAIFADTCGNLIQIYQKH